MKLHTCNYFKQETVTLKPIHSAKNRNPRTIKSCSLKQDLQGQSVAVIGLGKSGGAAARLALARGASVLAIDQNQNLGHLEKDSLFEKHNDGLSLRTILGDFDGELLKEVDVVVVSPGVSIESRGLACLLQSGKQVMSELDFAAQVIPRCIKILAVTGTNGKSTVVTFVGCLIILELRCLWEGTLEILYQRLLSSALHCLLQNQSFRLQWWKLAVIKWKFPINTSALRFQWY